MNGSEPAFFTMAHELAGRYTVRRVADALRHPELLRRLATSRALLVVTPTVERLHRTRLEGLLDGEQKAVPRIPCPSGERAKRLDAVERICDAAFDAGLDRKGLLVAIGGGVCCDLVTMSASLFRRGVRHVRVPTTLVGQVDAALGAKGGVNFAGRKNAIGCFHPPELVLIDERLMATLPRAEVSAGLAEIVKMALVSDRSLFELVEAAVPALIETRFQEPADAAGMIVALAARGMLEALGGNLFENRSHRRIVDAGHTFSPRLEAVSGFRLRHGEAVAIDLALSAVLAVRLELLAPAERDRIIAVLAAAGLPISSAHLTAEVCRRALAEATVHRGGALNLPLFEAIGRPCFVARSDVVEPVLEAALGDLHAASGDRDLLTVS